jgi:hypothetical protein
MFSNHTNAIYTDKKDRRLFVIRNEKAPKPQKYYDKLVETFDTDYETIYSFLMAHDLTGFNVHERPRMTRGKEIMIEQSITELAIFLADLENAPGSSPFSKPLFRSSDLLGYLEMFGPKVISGRAGTKAINEYLLENSFENRSISFRSGVKSSSARMWCKDWSKVKNAPAVVKSIMCEDEALEDKAVY